jgi:hypothetical protein
MTPLRQFKGVPQEVVRKAEGKQFVSPSGWYILRFHLPDLVVLSLGTVISTSARPRLESSSGFQMREGWFIDWFTASLNYSGSTTYFCMFVI